MEENTESVPAVSETDSQKIIHGNGRNRSGMRRGLKSGFGLQDAAEICGEVKDLSSCTEKLSGSNVKGYGDSSACGFSGSRDRRKRGDGAGNGERRRRFDRPNRETQSPEYSPQNGVDENVRTESAGESPREGPFFEEKKIESMAVDVALTDRRPRRFSANKTDDGVVSMTDADCSCRGTSFFARVKGVVRSIFGRKTDRKDASRNVGRKRWDKNAVRNGRGPRPNQKIHKGAARRGGQRRYSERRTK